LDLLPLSSVSWETRFPAKKIGYLGAGTVENLYNAARKLAVSHGGKIKIITSKRKKF
jgi:hypothetical protein